MDWVIGWLYNNLPLVVLLGLYIGLMVWHAWIGARRTRRLEDYYVGGRSMGGLVIGLSFFATYSSTNSYVGFSGQAYSYGIGWFLLIPFIVILSALSWQFVAPRLREATGRLESVTIPDYIGFRFESRVGRVLAALIVVIASLLYVTAVYKGIGALLSAFLGIGPVGSIVLVFAVVVFYTATGGFISVVRTDAVQGVLMVIAAVVLLLGASMAAGGLDRIWMLPDVPSSARMFEFDTAMPVSVLLGIIFATTVKVVVEPRQLSRFYALRDAKAARTGLWVSLACFLVVYSLLLPVGLLAHTLFPNGVDDTDQIVPLMVSSPEMFGPWASAFLVVAMVSAAMSSLDSVLLVIATTFQRDLLGTVVSLSESRALRITRVLVIVFAAFASWLALSAEGSIVTLTSISGSLYAVCFFPAVVLGLYWKRGDGAAVVTSFLIGAGAFLTWRYSPAGAWLHPVFPALVASLLAYTGMALRPRNGR